MSVQTINNDDGSTTTITTFPDGSVSTSWTPAPGSPAANAQTVAANLANLIASLKQDVTQDNSIQTNAATIINSTGTLSSATLSTYVRQLAQAVNVLAGNDINNKRALQNLLHQITGSFTDISGT